MPENYKTKIQELQKILKNIQIKNKDYRMVLQEAKKGDFVFLDPPYIEDKKYDFKYNKNEYFDIVELKQEAQKLDKREVKWMMTQIDTIEVRTLFKEYTFKNYNNKTNFNSTTTCKKEVIITNY